jgi:ATP-dependent Lon protease
VLPIGGVKEKLLGAHRAGIATVVLPRDNEPDLEDLPQEVLRQLEIHTVEEIDEVLPIALRGASLHDGRLQFAELGKVSPAREKRAGRGRGKDAESDTRFHHGR